MSLTKKLLGRIALTASLAGCHTKEHIPQEVITVEPERYVWVEVEGNSGTLWEAYMKERINHNKVAWKNYQKLVARRNSGRIERLPAVDGDSIVYFGGRFFSLADNTKKALEKTPIYVDSPEELK